MAYTKTTWVAGTAVTYTALNHIEEQYTEIMSYLTSHDHNSRYYTKAEVDSYFWDAGSDGAGSTLDADTLEGVEEAAIISGAAVGIGGWWYGTLDDFTDGFLNADPTWHICNGAGGSIDLQELFIIGAGGDFAVGATGGNNAMTPVGYTTGEAHVLTAAEAMHTHTMWDRYPGNTGRASGGNVTACTTASTLSVDNQTETAGAGTGHEHTGTFSSSTEYSLLPPFIALIPIQKVSS